MKTNLSNTCLFFFAVFLFMAKSAFSISSDLAGEVKIPIPMLGSAINTVPSSFNNTVNHKYKGSQVFEKNKGQWPEQVEFKTDLVGGRRLFLEKNKFTYVLYSPDDLYREHELEHANKKDVQEDKINAHAFKMEFVNANVFVKLEGDDKQSYYYNYFIGNDPSKWASEIPVFKTLRYKNLYEGIDLVAYEQDNNFKYDYIVRAGTDVKLIQLKFEGADKLELRNKNLCIITSAGDVIENIPYAYQTKDGVEVKVACEYELAGDGKTVSFYFPDGFDSRYELVIDPVVVASTYSGSNANTYGHCATHDAAGNIYTGGRCFNTGYPVTTGAIQIAYGGVVDIAVSKLNPTGSALLYATYLGGSSSDYPHSMFVNSSNELFVYGTSSSNNYPTSSGCYDNTYNGSSDIVVSKLNSTGTVLLGSTYTGGSGSDGINTSASYNYGDTYRGEIVVSNIGDVFVVSTTMSSDFPVTTGAYDITHNGSQDALVFKMNSGLTSLTWATYLGGTGNEAGCSIRFNSTGDVYVVGLTASSNFPSITGALNTTYQGGLYDGFISRFNSAGTTLVNSTFIGTSAMDINYFLDIDINNDIYIYGVSIGSMPVSTGVYSNAGSFNYLCKLNGALNTIIYSTVLGNGTKSTFSPSAMMVDVCQNVYLSGWGSNNGYPVTSSASQATTTGSCFHLMVLSAGATSLLYGSFFGTGGEHVDGGTSRFDPTGMVYQAVCSCSSTFPTLTNAYSPTKVSGSCDVVVFKIDFQINCNPLFTNTIICQGASANINILNVNTLANPSYSIQPGGSVSTSSSFTVSPSVTTTYTIYVTGTNGFNVLVTNTGVATVSVAPSPQASPTLTQATCSNTLNGFDLGLTFLPPGSTTPSYTVLWSQIPNGVLSPTQTSATGGISPGVYNATITTSNGCTTSTLFTINPVPTTVSFSVAGPFIVTCSNPTVTVTPWPTGYAYSWYGNTATLTGGSANFTVGNVGNWVINAIDANSGCVGSQSFVIGQNITVSTSTITPQFQNITCSITSVITVTAIGNPSLNMTHYWMSPSGGTLTSSTHPSYFQPGQPGTYTHVIVNNSNGCLETKTFTVTSSSGYPTFSVTSPQNFTLGCGSSSVAMIHITNAQTTPTPGGSVSYTVLGPSSATNYVPGSISVYSVNVPGTWTVITKDNTNMCESKTQVSVLQNTFAPALSLNVPQTRLTCYVSSVVLEGGSSTPNTSFNWSFPGTPGQLQSSSITVNANTAQTTNTLIANYTLTVIDNNSTCRSTTVISMEQNLFKPNAMISGGTNISCLTSSLDLTNQSSTNIPPSLNPWQPIIAYVWYGPSPQLEQQLTTTYRAYVPGIYTLTVRDLNNGCFATTTKTIDDFRVYPEIEKSEESFIFDCGTEGALIYPTVLNNTSALVYEWLTVPTASFTIVSKDKILVNKAGQYNVVITNTLNGCSSTGMLEVIDGSLHAAFVADNVSGFSPFTVNFTNTSSSSTSTNNITSFWNFGNGLGSNGIKQNTIAPVVYTQPGIYIVTLYVQKGVCMDSAAMSIHVEIPSELIVPNIFSPNGDGSNDVFFVKASNIERIEIVIVDRWGHTVYELSSNTGNIAWDGKNQFGNDSAEGTYMYKLKASGSDGAQYKLHGNITLVR